MKKIYNFIILILSIVFTVNIFATDLLTEFKNSSIYKESGLFKNAFMTNANVLILEPAEKFTAVSDKNKIIKEISFVLSEINKSEDSPVLVGIKEDILKTTIYKIKKGGSFDKVEEVGGSYVNEEKSIYTSMGLSGNLNGLSSVGILAGSYLLNNSLDFAGNLNVSTQNLSMGFLGRIHFLISSKLDLNAGAQVSFNINDNDETTTSLSALLGISNFISYRSSLDFSLNISTAGIISLGAAITYYANMMPPLLTEQPPEYKKPEIKTISYEEKVYTTKPTNTPAYTDTFLPTFTYTYTPTYTPTHTPTHTFTILITPEATSIPTKQIKETQTQDIEELKAKLKEEILQELKQEKKDEKVLKETKKDTVSGFFFGINLFRYMQNLDIESDIDKYFTGNFRFGFGGDNIFGNCFNFDGTYFKYFNLDFAYIFNLDIAFEFFPFLRSPSGLYIGPVIGGGFYHGEKTGIIIDSPIFSLGGAAGYRFLFDWFVLDLGVKYKAHLVIKDEEYEISDPLPHTVYTKDMMFFPEHELIII